FVISLSFCKKQCRIKSQALIDMAGVEQLIVILPVVVGLIVVRFSGFLSARVIDPSIARFQIGLRNAIPGLVCFFISLKQIESKGILIINISGGEIKGS